MGDLFDMLGANGINRVCITGSAIQTRIITAPAPWPSQAPRANGSNIVTPGTRRELVDYATQYKQQEEAQMRGNAVSDACDDLQINQEVTDVLEIDGELENNDTNLNQTCHSVYNRYFARAGVRGNKNLPIVQYRDRIVGLIESKAVTIIQGFTGCGKTTQVPQYILDHYASMGKPCKIVVTQPRRIAAISIAKRVCEERQWSLGTVVGYKVGMASEFSNDTILTYMTTGCLLEHLIKEKSFASYTHLFIDEVHERDEDTDFLLMIVRKLLTIQAAPVKVVLMSATIDSQKFASYFVLPVRGIPEKAPMYALPEEPMFPIQEHYLEELQRLGELPRVRLEEPLIEKSMYSLAATLIVTLDELERLEGNPRRGAVLVFLPGYAEIATMMKELDSRELQYRHGAAFGSYYKWRVLPLHSSITMEEQDRVFKPAGVGERKIILSTNIAESSITVSDISYVIDFCLTKQLDCDAKTDFYHLKVEWASKSSCQQRRGRVGRVGPGRVYRLLPSHLYQELPEEATPEILRCPLEKAVLRTKTFEMGEPKALLALLIDHPDLGSIQRTILTLKEVGALLLTCDGKYHKEDGDLTFLGRVMARLPLDVRLSKLIALGRAFNVLDEAIIIAAGLSSKSIFSTPFSERLMAYHHKLTWADGSFSDPFAILNAYKVWSNLKLAGDFERSSRHGQNLEFEWGRRNFIQIKAMWDMQIAISEIRYRLKSLDMESARGQGGRAMDPNQKALILKIVIAGAFYPHYFNRSRDVDEQEAVRTLSNRNPCHTVMFTGFPAEQPPELYKPQIQQFLKSCVTEGEQILVHIEGTKVFVEFLGNLAPRIGSSAVGGALWLPGRVNTAVYKAVKMRLMKASTIIRLLKPTDTLKYLNRPQATPLNGISTLEPCVFSDDLSPPALPRLKTQYMVAEVSHVIDPAHFFIQLKDEESSLALRTVFEVLNQQVLAGFLQPPPEDAIVVAPFAENEVLVEWFRARVVKKFSDHTALVYFIDYGNTAEVSIRDLKKLSHSVREIGPLALECVLTGTVASSVKDGRGLWVSEAVKLFKTNVMERLFFVKVYSVVQGVLSVDLAPHSPENEPIVHTEAIWKFSIAKLLKNLGYAEPQPENYLSRANHETRRKWRDISEDGMLHIEKEQLPPCYKQSKEKVEPIDGAAFSVPCSLKGPVSTLETKPLCLFSQGAGQEVKIEPDSVNSVFLDTQPEDPHDRLLVAASVSAGNGNMLLARSTTLLPNIHGLPGLLSLLFAPQAELRVDSLAVNFIGAVCGLGAQNGEALYPAHDMEVPFDVEIDLEDLITINRVRYWLNQVLDPLPGQEIGSFEIASVQEKIVDMVYTLVMKERRSISPAPWRLAFQWGTVRPEMILHSGATDRRSIFRIHDGVQLLIADSERLEKLKKNKEAMTLAVHSGPPREIECLFCRKFVTSGKSMAIHLDGKLHRDNEERLAPYLYAN